MFPEQHQDESVDGYDGQTAEQGDQKGGPTQRYRTDLDNPVVGYLNNIRRSFRSKLQAIDDDDDDDDEDDDD